MMVSVRYASPPAQLRDPWSQGSVLILFVSLFWPSMPCCLKMFIGWNEFQKDPVTGEGLIVLRPPGSCCLCQSPHCLPARAQPCCTLEAPHHSLVLTSGWPWALGVIISPQTTLSTATDDEGPLSVIMD